MIFGFLQIQHPHPHPKKKKEKQKKERDLVYNIFSGKLFAPSSSPSNTVRDIQWNILLSKSYFYTCWTWNKQIS